MREIASSLNLNWQEKQSEFRRNSSKGTYLRISLQCLDNNDVLLLLESILQSSKEIKVHRRSTQLGVWEQYRCIRCMDVDINKETIQWLLHSVAGVLDAKTCRAKYKFKIENVTQLLEFHALSDHQTLKKPAISICVFGNFFGQINEPSGINCLMKYTVCLSMSLLNLNDRSLINTARTVLFLDHMWSVNVFVFKVEDDENVFETHVIV